MIVSRVTTRSFVFSSPLRDEARGWIYFALSDACARKNEYPSYLSRVVVARGRSHIYGIYIDIVFIF